LTGLDYALVCPIAYLLSGLTKFAINSFSLKRPAFDQIGLGRFPSTHTAIVSSAVWLIALKGGVDQPAFAVAVGVLLVVIIDAMDLRRKLERVNHILKAKFSGTRDVEQLRDRVGHTPLEVAGGLAAGAVAAWLVN
jgi:acid phosphatase family membrane protein YuiD